MKTVVFDTDVLIDHTHGYAPWIDKLLIEGNVRFIIPTIVCSEFFTSNIFDDEKQIKKAEEGFIFFERQDFTYDCALNLASLLRHKTFPSGASISDLMIAATSLFLSPMVLKNAMATLVLFRLPCRKTESF